MINAIPRNWTYNENLEMLFLLYQCADELLSETTFDTYMLPLHNTITLLDEIEEIFKLLKKYNIVNEHYGNYIPPIIDEFLEQLENDFILKKVLNKRLINIRTGFFEAKSNSALLQRWIDLIRQICSKSLYKKLYESEIIDLVTNTKNKKELIFCLKNYYISLKNYGYSREYLYTTTKRFFNNKKKNIDDPNIIKEYLSSFNCKDQKYHFLILMDYEVIEYIDSINNNIKISDMIKKIDVDKEREELSKDSNVFDLFKQYDSKIHNEGKYEKVAVVEYDNLSSDPYSSATQFNELVNFLQTFTRYFKHFYTSKTVYKMLLKCNDGHYIEIRLPNKLQKRPYFSQELIDSRIKNILNAKSMDLVAFSSIAKAIEMHSEAYDSKNIGTLLKLFWTALETLFSNPVSGSTRDNVVNSVTAIIQKTYILKLLRNIHSQLLSAIEEEKTKEIGIFKFNDFVSFFAINKYDSDNFKKIYNHLSDNPMLRSRIYEMRKTMDNGLSISCMLKEHQTRITWQLRRLYRIRNISTHLGNEVSGINVAINHLHNYFDYSVNFLLCKSENGDFIKSTSSVVFEAKNDNQIHMELLKNNEPLSKENYMDYLFGPDHRLINYDFQ